MAGAKVTILNEGTRVAYEATTTSAGDYAVTGLAPGTYSVMVNQPGFSAFGALHNVLNIGAPLVVNVKLQIGSTGEKVEVEGSYERVDTTSAMISAPAQGCGPLNPAGCHMPCEFRARR